MKPNKTDPFLEKRVSKYDTWLHEGKVSCSSKVIPVSESLEGKKWILPTEQVLEILRNAHSFALAKCDCRSHYQRCDNPLEVCFFLNDMAEKFVTAGKARHISFEEAAEVLRNANKSGLVHLSLYMPDHEIYALCNCCACCCHDLQIIRLYQRSDWIVRSEYLAITNMETCIHCGACIERCLFDARKWENGQMIYNVDACYGCGLCVTVCPVDATMMLQKGS